MSDLLQYLIDVLEFIPTNVIMVGFVIYLAWFNKRYVEKHELLKNKVEENTECVENSKKVDNEMLLLILKGLITNDNLPNFVRLDFYKTYKEYHGNSWVDAYVKENVVFTNQHYGRRYDDNKEYIFEKDKENGAVKFYKEREEEPK